MENQLNSVESLATRIRIHSLRMTNHAKSSHIGSCLSCADILAVLYSSILRVRPSQPDWEGRDRLVLSKGHAGAALYAVLAECGFFPLDLLDTYCREGSELIGHASHHIPGVEISTGSLGHGLPIACGMALANQAHRVFAVLSEGDCDEGSTWEAAMFAAHHGLDNLTVIIDHNELQAMGLTQDVLSLSSLVRKWEAFGWRTIEVDGHDCPQLEAWMKQLPLALDRPSCLVAHTIKGKGVSFMEGKVEWHYKFPNDTELAWALKELQV